ncbi:3-ketoacyl-ACP reductase [Bacillus sp. FJAT-18017]|uniref:2-dehydro-3-deoxy-D-gluconate 5-dehydrogenase KduD n=1 Tax=Bacillus sp. FJAT-18017 TaxID=1705566 RepID=UPI0006AF8D09|nr:2-dehydro-3-deoxy-D-gluconate 5-dehydrogenase KduD [Bacillus sp. FJAT-18017]ALC89210.1 3-ketoacyl-ACP reductase [Bacillus sp. FJAT-18017]
MKSMFDLTGKTAVVTGGSQGLGKGMAIGLAKAGADIAIISRRENTETVAEIEGLGRRCKTFRFDLRNFGQYEQLVEDIKAEFSQIDILLNNAGMQRRHPSAEFPKEDWDFVMDINANAVFFLSQAVGKDMLKRGHGKIINLASLLSFQGGLTVPAYAASKGAVIQFTKSLSNEWARYGVNVNCIAPGYMETEMNNALINDEVRSRQILERIPAGRWGKPEDLAGAAVFLASKASDYINGETIVVDGGWMGR